MLDSDADLANVVAEYDTILALSVTKWIHLNFSDLGLKRFFKRIHRALLPGGRFVLEPQPWSSYRLKRRMTVCASVLDRRLELIRSFSRWFLFLFRKRSQKHTIKFNSNHPNLYLICFRQKSASKHAQQLQHLIIRIEVRAVHYLDSMHAFRFSRFSAINVFIHQIVKFH